MGGSLYGAERMPLEKFKELMLTFLPKLKEALGEIEFTPVPFYSEKEDFGDLDVLVKGHTGLVRELVVEHFGFIPEDFKTDHSHQYTTNANVFSFIYEKFQVDLICTVEQYETSLAYYSYNDVGNILGRFYHKLGLKFGHEGLLRPLRDERGIVRKELVICKDINKILEFLGLETSKWHTGFSTLEDIFEWVATGKYFDPNIFLGELSAINEKRDRKRKTFSKFLDWVENEKPKQNHVFVSRDERDNYIPEIEEFFECDITTPVEEFNKQLARERIVKEKYNGEIVMEITGLKGQQLGSWMGLFKDCINHIGSSKGKTFDDFLDERDADFIKDMIKTEFESHTVYWKKTKGDPFWIINGNKPD